MNPTLADVTRAQLPDAFGTTLRALREAQGLSQEELAHRARTNQAYVSMLESGKRGPSLATVQLLAQALGMSMTALVRAVEAHLD